MKNVTDDVIAKLAARQHGVVGRAQLLEGGVSPQAVEYRVRTRRLQRIQRGVYLVGPTKTPYTVTMAAVLACGSGAAASHVTGADVLQMLSAPDKSAPVDVTVLRRNCGYKRGIRIHRVRALCADEVTRHNGIPVTSPARTLLDLAPVTSPRKLEQALAVAERRRLTDRTTIYSLLDRYPGRPGVGVLRSLLDAEAEPAMTRSEAEERLLHLIRRARLGKLRTNVLVVGHEVDFFWPKQRVVVEVDGFAYHSSTRAFERDRCRDAELLAAGYGVHRVTWKQIVNEPEAVVARLARTLTRAELRHRP